jgi:hypothetical protein
MSGFKSDQAANHVIDEVVNEGLPVVDAKDSIYKGSVGDMVALDTNDKVDNVLLEYIIAWHWLRKEGTYLQSIYPIMVGKKRPDGTYERFDMSLLDKLPQKPSHKTNETDSGINLKNDGRRRSGNPGNETENGETSRPNDAKASGFDDIRHGSQR